MPFDTGKEAEQIEKLAHECMDEGNDGKAKDIGNKLAAEWLSLDQSQRNAVAAELEKKYDNFAPNTLPTPRLIRNDKGDVVEVDFTASIFDFSSGSHKIELVDDTNSSLAGTPSVSVFGLYNQFDGSGVWHAKSTAENRRK